MFQPFAALNQLKYQVEERYKEEQKKNNHLKTKQDVEKAHANFLRNTYSPNSGSQNSTLKGMCVIKLSLPLPFPYQDSVSCDD